jgi:hypothetical protein
MSAASPRNRTLAGVLLLAVALAGCGSTVSTSGFKGEEHAVAQAVADLQSNATAGDQGKVCHKNLAASVVTRLGGVQACEAALKGQLSEIDSLEASVKSVQVAPSGKSATATIESVYEGKKRKRTVTLVKEGGSWKVESVA